MTAYDLLLTFTAPLGLISETSCATSPSYRQGRAAPLLTRHFSPSGSIRAHYFCDIVARACTSALVGWNHAGIFGCILSRGDSLQV